MKKINEITILAINLLYIIPILFSNNWIFDLTLTFLALINIILLRKINIKLLALFLIFMLPALLSLFLTTLLYTKGSTTSPVIATFLSFNIHKLAFQNGLFLIARAFSLSFISFIFILSINQIKLVNSLMQILKLSPIIGFSLLTSFNAFSYLKEEFLRIELAYKMRFLKKIFPLFLIFPLLVSASRFAHFAGLSMECRGLNKKRTFFEKSTMSKIDFFVIILNLIQITLLILYFKNINSIAVRIF